MRLISDLHQADRRIDGGVCRGAEEEELRGAQPQDLMAEGVGALQRPLDQQTQNRVDLAQASQGGGEQEADEGSVAWTEDGETVVPR